MSKLRKNISIAALLLASLVIVAHSVVPHHHHSEHQAVTEGALHTAGSHVCGGSCGDGAAQISQNCEMGDCTGLLPFVLRMGSDISNDHNLLLCAIVVQIHSSIDSAQVTSFPIVYDSEVVCQLIQTQIVASLPHRGPPMC